MFLLICLANRPLFMIIFIKMKEMVGGCCVCSDERGWAENPLVYCDGHGCNVAVHQACYGIVQVPTGPWFCRKCESQERAARVRCELCPQREGALKRTDTGVWCHVVCALFIPEAWFANVQTMEPIVLKNVPPERFNKICYICEEHGRNKAGAGACMQCNKNGCKQHFHVTCAQARGQLCEEAGHYGDNVKYCGYCAYHYKKLKKDGNIKTIPAFKPVGSDSGTSDSSPEKTPLTKADKKEQKRPGLYSVSSESIVTSMRLKESAITSISGTDNIHNRDKGSNSVAISGAVHQVSPARAVGSDSGSSLISPTEFLGFTESDVHSATLNNSFSSGSLKSGLSSNIGSASLSQGEQRLILEARLTVPPKVESKSCCSGKGGFSPSSSAVNHMPSDHPEPSSSSSPSPSSNHHTSPSLQQNGTHSSSQFAKHFENLNSKLPVVSLQQGGVDNGDGPASLMMKRSRSRPDEKGDKKKARKEKESGHLLQHGQKGRTIKDMLSGKGEETNAKKLVKKKPPNCVTTQNCRGSNLNTSVFGGRPYFQSLTASGPISLTNLTKTGETTPDDMTNGPALFSPPKPAFCHSTNKSTDLNSGSLPVTMEELLERQWEQGSQFLMEQAQHFDIASLLNCLNQLKSENSRLEGLLNSLVARRDHLLAVNARLAASAPSPSSSVTPSTSPESPLIQKGSRVSTPGAHSDIGATQDCSSNKSGAGITSGHATPPSQTVQTKKDIPTPKKLTSLVNKVNCSLSPDTRVFTTAPPGGPSPSHVQLPALAPSQPQIQTFVVQQSTGLTNKTIQAQQPQFMYPMLGGQQPLNITLSQVPSMSMITAMHSYPIPVPATTALSAVSKSKPSDIQPKDKS
ncbi:protein AF-10-like [Liolophura sinensis]|uniref:protein AF-10-like n=1 Tax=Liolophura sinensis TaxID=3198878 RepID=UPI003159778F